MGLFLFTLHKNDKQIGFPAADEHKGFIYNFLPYEETLNKELIIDLQSKTGNVPRTITKKISDIIAEGEKN